MVSDYPTLAQHANELVLILVVMEYGLRRLTAWVGTVEPVLILVVMEYGLRLSVTIK